MDHILTHKISSFAMKIIFIHILIIVYNSIAVIAVIFVPNVFLILWHIEEFTMTHQSLSWTLHHIMTNFWWLFLMKQDIIYSLYHWISNTSQSARRGILNNMSLDDWRSLGIDFKVVELCNIRLHSSGQRDIYKQGSLLPQIQILWTIVTYIHDSFEP